LSKGRVERQAESREGGVLRRAVDVAAVLVDGAKVEEDPDALALRCKRREGTRNGAQVVAARVGVVGLQPAVGDADDSKGRVERQAESRVERRVERRAEMQIER